MESKELIREFWESRANIDDPRLATQFRVDNSLKYDLELVKRFLPEGGDILDLGCGTCTLTNELVEYASFIQGVDSQVGLLKQCKVNQDFKVAVGDIIEYKDNNRYDVILLIGVLNYIIDEKEVNRLYANCYEMLKPNGYLIVKHQSGVERDVEVKKYSEELQTNYYALYRYKNKDEMLLTTNGFAVETIDIYPPIMNPWSNTHHYAYVANKNQTIK